MVTHHFYHPGEPGGCPPACASAAESAAHEYAKQLIGGEVEPLYPGGEYRADALRDGTYFEVVVASPISEDKMRFLEALTEHNVWVYDLRDLAQVEDVVHGLPEPKRVVTAYYRAQELARYQARKAKEAKIHAAEQSTYKALAEKFIRQGMEPREAYLRANNELRRASPSPSGVGI